MLYRTITKSEFRRLVLILMEHNEVVGPKRMGDTAEGRPIHQYLPIESFDEIDLDYEMTTYSAKTYFLPFCENLSTCEFNDDDWEQKISYRLMPRVLLGLHACDINALLKLDKVMARDTFPNPYYISRRQNTFIVGIDHQPCEGGFCRSVGADVVTHGFDLFLTDLGDRYFMAINSDRGFEVLSNVTTEEISDKDRNNYLKVRQQMSVGYQELNMQNLPNLLDIEFESGVWEKWGSKCMSCGSCAMVCPTCYCYGVNERIAMDSSQSFKVKQMYSCNLLDFATVAGGHNFRTKRETRLKYRYYHQHRGFSETFGEPMCVGCNRCGRVCLAGIHPAGIIEDLQTEYFE